MIHGDIIIAKSLMYVEWGPDDTHPYLYKVYSYTNNMSIAKEILDYSSRNNFKVTSIKTKKVNGG
jgi:hypothetical protein